MNIFRGVVNIIFYSVLLIALIAPFTFQKLSPPKKEKTVLVQPTVKPVIKKFIELPLHDVVLPKFSKIKSVQNKKKAFFNFLRPVIISENNKINEERLKLQTMLTTLSLGEILDKKDVVLFQSLANKYKVSNKKTQLQQAKELLSRIDIIPEALVLVQAANESAWGTSRFARIGLNFFGIWCYREGCGMVPNGRSNGDKHEVAAFNSVDSAIKRYLYNINTHSAYRLFRTIRSQLRAQNQPLTAKILATGLMPYSERGVDYVLEITQMLRHNQNI